MAIIFEQENEMSNETINKLSKKLWDLSIKNIDIDEDEAV